MPITADRMQKIIDLATQALSRSERARTVLDHILDEIEDEVLDGLVLSIQLMARDTGKALIFPAEELQNLMHEEAWFNLNQQKHKGQAARMRMLRAGHRTLPFKARGAGDKTVENILTTEHQVRLDMQEEIEIRKRIGQEQHPDQGPCNSDADGQCSWCAQASAASVPNSQMDLEREFAHIVKPLMDDVLKNIGHDDVEFVVKDEPDEPDFQHEQWLPKQHKEQDA